MSTLDSILSGGGEALPPTDTTTQETVTPPTANPDLPAADAMADGQDGAADAEGTEGGPKTVPLTALHAERQKVKRYTEEVADFRRSNETLQRQVSELLQRVPVPQQEQKPKPDFFENPDAAVLSTVTPLIEQAQREYAELKQRLDRTELQASQRDAVREYGADKVKDAEDAFVAAVQNRTLDPADYQRVVNNPDRYGAVVEWRRIQKIILDPQGYEAEILAKHGLTGGGNSGAPAAPAPVMPSNIAGARNVGSRTGPAWGGPKPLGDIFKR